MTDQLPFAFWQSETHLGTFLLTDLQDMTIASINTDRALLFWGDGNFDRIPANGSNYTYVNHVYSTVVSGGQERQIQFTPATKIRQLSVASNYVSGASSTYRATVFLNACQNMLVAQFQDVPLTDVNFTGVYNLQTLTISFSILGIYRTQNIDLNSALSLENLLLSNSDITTINLTGNTHLGNLDCYANPLSTLTFNVTGNPTLGILQTAGLSNLVVETDRTPNVFHLELAGSLGTVDLNPLTQLSTFSLGNTSNSMPLNTIIASLPVGNISNPINIQLFGVTSTEPIVSVGSISGGKLHALDIRNSTFDYLVTQALIDGGPDSFDAMFNTKYVNVDGSTITPSSTSEIIVQIDKGVGPGPSVGGILDLGDRAFDSTWTDYEDPLQTTYDVNAALTNIANKYWIISTTDSSVYTGILGVAYFYSYFTAISTNPSIFLQSSFIKINSYIDGTYPNNSTIVGGQTNGQPSWQFDTGFGANNIVMSMYSNFLLPICTAANPSTPITFNVWLDSTAGFFDGEVRIDFNPTIDPLIVYPNDDGQQFNKNPFFMQGRWHQINWTTWQIQSGVPTAVDIGNGSTGGTIMFADTDVPLIIPMSDPYYDGDPNFAPEGFTWMNVAVS